MVGGPWPDAHGFLNKPHNPVTGLSDVGARSYDPTLGRFLSVDPILDPASPQQWNGYGYANNNPVTHSDPTGLLILLDDNNASIPRIQDANPQTIANAEARAHNNQKANKKAKLKAPALGRKPDPKVLEGLRKNKYTGSDDFTYSDAVEYALSDPMAGIIVCQLMGGSPDDCRLPGGLHDLPENAAKFAGDVAYALSPIGDVQDCAGGDALSCATAVPALKWLKFFDKVNDTRKALPPDFATAGRNAEDGVSVYLGVSNGKGVYVGITNDIARRAGQHGSRFDRLREVTTASVTRGEARAIEQALIARNPGFQNKVNSVSPKHPYYQGVVEWGETWLQANGF